MLLTGDYSAMVMAAVQVFLITNIIGTDDPNAIHDMPYISKRKLLPRNKILVCANHFMKSFLTCLDIWISTSTKRRQKRHRKWKT